MSMGSFLSYRLFVGFDDVAGDRSTVTDFIPMSVSPASDLFGLGGVSAGSPDWGVVFGGGGVEPLGHFGVELFGAFFGGVEGVVFAFVGDFDVDEVLFV